MAYFKNISFSFIELYIELLLDNYLKANIFFQTCINKTMRRKKQLVVARPVYIPEAKISQTFIFFLL